jgi:hypothetical protein
MTLMGWTVFPHMQILKRVLWKTSGSSGRIRTETERRDSKNCFIAFSAAFSAVFSSELVSGWWKRL